MIRIRGLRRATPPPAFSRVNRSCRRPARYAATVLAALALLSSAAAQPVAVFSPPKDAGRLSAPPRNEASGLAMSRRGPDLLWTHDDSGGEAALYAVGDDGRSRGKLQIGGGVKNDDWEDLAAVELDGRAWLVIGDIGDNDAKRRNLLLHFVPEPEPRELSAARQLAERPVATLRLTYEDGPRDAESLAIDAAERAIYVLSKRDDIPRLYRGALPAAPLASGEVRLRFVGRVPHVPKPTASQLSLKGHLGKQRARPCAMDFATDGSAAVVLTYGDLLLFPRQANEPWAETLARAPIVLAPHGLPQAEAVCFSPDGATIFVASESSRTLLRYDRK